MEHFPVNCFFLKALACLNSICAWKDWNYIRANATPDSPSHLVLPAFSPMHSQFENPLIQDSSSNSGDISFAGHLLSRAVAKTAAPRRTRAWYGRSTNVPGDKGIEALRSLSIFVNLGAGGYTAWLLVLYWSIMYFSTSCNLLLYGMDISISEHIRTTNQKHRLIIGWFHMWRNWYRIQRFCSTRSSPRPWVHEWWVWATVCWKQPYHRPDMWWTLPGPTICERWDGTWPWDGDA